MFWRRVRDLAELNLWKLLERHGTRRIAARQPDALDRAVANCLDCKQTRNCDAMVASGGDAGTETFCPNVMYLRYLQAMKRHEPKPALTGTP
jgi:hypothetical protein